MTHESHARLTELCSIGRANRLLALLVELNVDLLMKFPQKRCVHSRWWVHRRDESTVKMNAQLCSSLDEPIAFLKLIGWWAYKPPIKSSFPLYFHSAVLDLAGLGPAHTALLISGWLAVLMTTTIATRSLCTSWLLPQPYISCLTYSRLE